MSRSRFTPPPPSLISRPDTGSGSKRTRFFMQCLPRANVHVNFHCMAVLVLMFIAFPLQGSNPVAQPYLFFATAASQYRGFAFQMDENGNIHQLSEFPIGWDSHHIIASPNGRAVVLTSHVEPFLSLFFINADGSLDPPIYLSPSGFTTTCCGLPAAFHPTLPLLYVGKYPRTYILNIDYQNRSVSDTGLSQEVFSSATEHICYSAYANSLLMTTDNNQKVDSYILNADGTFNGVKHQLTLANEAPKDFMVSPDGRWAVATSTGYPKLHMIKINKDGSLERVEEYSWDFPDVGNGSNVVFTHDSRRMFLFSEGNRTPILFDIDQSTGRLTEFRSLMIGPPYDDIIIRISFTVTPDLRWGVFRSLDLANNSYIHVIEIRPDGEMILRRDKRFQASTRLGDLQFAPPYPLSADTPWNLYE